MKSRFSTLVFAVLLAGFSLVSSKGFSQNTAAREAMMQLTSPAFKEGAVIPDQYTCKGANTSPELAWSGAPAGTKSFALIVEDPDAPKGTYTHWVAYNIEADKKSLPSNLPAEKRADGVLQGLNDFGKAGYGGPCPPKGDNPHRYVFRLYALDTTLDLQPGAGKSDVNKAIADHVLEKAELTGRYQVK